MWTQLQSKIFTKEDLLAQVAEWKKADKKVVFTNGCFDILHPGHVEYLAKAANLGDKLIVALNTDASVKRLKGLSRPIQNQEARALILAALFFVDAVVLFDTDTPLSLIQEILPDVLVKGGDYEPQKIVGYQEVINHGGEVQIISFVEGMSSTNIINKILN